MTPKENDIRSTEKLLELIRNENADVAPSHDQIAPGRSSKATLIPSAFQKRTVIGVDIGHTHIKLAKVLRTEKRAELIDYLDVPFNTSVSITDEQFLKSLKQKLDQFCEGLSNFDIWGAMQSANVETRCIRIPKLPRKQIPNAIFWTFTKKNPFDRNIEILDYEIIGDISEDGVKKTEVLAFKAPKSEIELYRSAFEKIGYPLKGISIVPFAIQNLFRAGVISHPQDDICCLFVGRDWSRIAVYNRGSLVLSRGIKAGMRSMVDTINNALKRKDDLNYQTAEAVPKEVGTRPADSGAIDPKAQQIFFDFIGVPASESIPGDIATFDHKKVFQIVLPALERMIRQIERTFEHYALNFNTEGVKRIYISGQVIANQNLVRYFEKQLGIPVVPMNPFPPNGPFTQQVRIPDTVSDREGFVPAIGLALSSNTITPNFLFTHEDKDFMENVRRNNMRILTICLVCLMVMIGIFSWQQRKLDRQIEHVEELNNQLIKYNPPAKKDLLLALYAKAQQKHKVVTQIIHRYAPAAIVTELADITPSNIRLLRIEAKFLQQNRKGPKASENSVVIEGIIFGGDAAFETMLTNYLLNLKNSPVFRRPSVQSKQMEYYHDQEIMRFTTKLEVI